jgi:hypothetical protein
MRVYMAETSKNCQPRGGVIVASARINPICADGLKQSS